MYNIISILYIWLTIFANYNLLTQTPNPFLLSKQYIRSASWKNNREAENYHTCQHSRTAASTAQPAEVTGPNPNTTSSCGNTQQEPHPRGERKNHPRITWGKTPPHLEGHQLASRLWRKALVFSCAQACASVGQTIQALHSQCLGFLKEHGMFFFLPRFVGKKNTKESLWVRLRSYNFSQSRSLWGINYVSREGDSQRHGSSEFHFFCVNVWLVYLTFCLQNPHQEPSRICILQRLGVSVSLKLAYSRQWGMVASVHPLTMLRWWRRPWPWLWDQVASTT